MQASSKHEIRKFVVVSDSKFCLNAENFYVLQIVFALLVGTAVAAPSGHHLGGHLLAAPLAAPVIATAPAVVGHATQVNAVHHPAVVNTHLAPTAIVAQTPTLSGYSYTSQVRHDAPGKLTDPLDKLRINFANVFQSPLQLPSSMQPQLSMQLQ